MDLKDLKQVIKDVVEEGKQVYDNGSTQFQVPEEIADDIIYLGESIPDEDIYGEGEYGRETDIHCTVLYGLVSDDLRELRGIIEAFPKFSVTLGDISYFEQDDHDVMKIEVHGDKLHELHHLIDDNIENVNSYPEYQPHVTIAYVTKDFDKDPIENDLFNGDTFDVTEIVVSKKDGSTEIINLK